MEPNLNLCVGFLIWYPGIEYNESKTCSDSKFVVHLVSTSLFHVYTFMISHGTFVTTLVVPCVRTSEIPMNEPCDHRDIAKEEL